MANYIVQQEAELAQALREKRDADRKAEIAEGRYDAAKENKAGAGRGKQGGPTAEELKNYQEGGATKKVTELRKGGRVSSASTRADGAAQRGKTRGRIR
jgi:hypothetical protein